MRWLGLPVVAACTTFEDPTLVIDLRVIAMTALPGRVKADVRITLPRPRDPTSPSFNDHRRALENLLAEGIAAEAAASPEGR